MSGRIGQRRLVRKRRVSGLRTSGGNTLLLLTLSCGHSIVRTNRSETANCGTCRSTPALRWGGTRA